MSNSSDGASDVSVSGVDKVYCILLVDDESGLREITESRLISSGFRVSVAVNGLHAMQKLKGAKEPFDMVITDIHMQGQGGLDLIANIKASPEFKHIPLIALTGSLDVQVLKSAKQKGALDVLIKPVSFQTLLERIQRYL